MHNITDEEIMEFYRQMKEEKGMKNFEMPKEKKVETSEDIVKAINLLISHYAHSTGLTDTVVGLKIVLERFGIVDECVAIIDFDDYTVRPCLISDLGEDE